jgi:hypothetical protein
MGPRPLSCNGSGGSPDRQWASALPSTALSRASVVADSGTTAYLQVRSPRGAPRQTALTRAAAPLPITRSRKRLGEHQLPPTGSKRCRTPVRWPGCTVPERLATEAPSPRVDRLRTQRLTSNAVA